MREKLNIVLGSKSAARVKILRDIGFNVKTHPVNIDERLEEENFFNKITSEDGNKAIHNKYAELSEFLAYKKMEKLNLEVDDGNHYDCLITSDQVLVFKKELIHKSSNKDELFNKLKKLNGNEHKLISSACVKIPNLEPVTISNKVTMKMKKLSNAEIEDYVDKHGDKVLSSVGGYHFESEGSKLFHDVNGDYFTVLGLPMYDIIRYFVKNGVASL